MGMHADTHRENDRLMDRGWLSPGQWEERGRREWVGESEAQLQCSAHMQDITIRLDSFKLVICEIGKHYPYDMCDWSPWDLWLCVLQTPTVVWSITRKGRPTEELLSGTSEVSKSLPSFPLSFWGGNLSPRRLQEGGKEAILLLQY